PPKSPRPHGPPSRLTGSSRTNELPLIRRAHARARRRSALPEREVVMVARGSARPAIRAATVAAILIVASFLAPHPAVGDDLAAASTRVIALADRPEEIPPALLSTAKKTPSIGLERRGIASLTAAELDAADAILVRIPGDDLSALESPLVAAAVERGKGLVVIAGQDALLRIADDPRLAALLSLRPHDAES